MTRLLLLLALTLAAQAQELHLSVNASQQTLAQRVQAAAPPSAPPPPAATPQRPQPPAVEVRFHFFQSGPALGASVRL